MVTTWDPPWLQKWYLRLLVKAKGDRTTHRTHMFCAEIDVLAVLGKALECFCPSSHISLGPLKRNSAPVAHPCLRDRRCPGRLLVLPHELSWKMGKTPSVVYGKSKTNRIPFMGLTYHLQYILYILCIYIYMWYIYIYSLVYGIIAMFD